MSDLLHVVSVMLICLTLLGITLLVLLALPQCKLRSIALEITKYLMAFALALLVVSPIDVIPDVIPALGFGDDIAYIIAAIASYRSARRERAERQLIS